MTFLKDKEIAKALAKNQKDLNRILNIMNSFSGVYSRDNTGIVHNGFNNMCRYYVLERDRFAAWLSLGLSAFSSDDIGIYIARPRTERWEIDDRLSIAADTGKISNIHHVGVIRTAETNDALEYAKRAHELFNNINIVIVHDESGKHDDDALLSSKDIKVFKMTNQIADKGKFIRYTGDSIENERVVELYHRSAKNVCAEILNRRLENLFEGEFVPEEVPDELISLLSCGKKTKGFSMNQYCANGISEPQIYDNASYNIPYDEWDRRAFTFSDTDELLESFYEHSDILDEIYDILEIWEYGARLAKVQDVEIFSIGSIYNDIIGRSGAKNRMKKRNKAIKEYGIDSMVDSYYAGVPLSDILA